jgi:hypothetical protein
MVSFNGVLCPGDTHLTIGGYGMDSNRPRNAPADKAKRECYLRHSVGFPIIPEF